MLLMADAPVEPDPAVQEVAGMGGGGGGGGLLAQGYLIQSVACYAEAIVYAMYLQHGMIMVG